MLSWEKLCSRGHWLTSIDMPKFPLDTMQILCYEFLKWSLLLIILQGRQGVNDRVIAKVENIQKSSVAPEVENSLRQLYGEQRSLHGCWCQKLWVSCKTYEGLILKVILYRSHDSNQALQVPPSLDSIQPTSIFTTVTVSWSQFR